MSSTVRMRPVSVHEHRGNHIVGCKHTRALRLLLAVATVIALVSCSHRSTDAQADDTTIRMQLPWLISAQFAGYVVALDKGYYDQRNLRVTIAPGGPDINTIQQLVSDQADVTSLGTEQLFQARSQGAPIQVFAQFGLESTTWLIARKSNGIFHPSDLRGKTIGAYSASTVEYYALLEAMGLDKSDVETLFQGITMDPWLNGEYPAAQVYTFDGLQTIYEAGVKPEELTTFNPSDFGVGLLIDALGAEQDFIEANREALTAFVDATVQGFEYAFEHPDEAVAAVVKHAGGDADPVHERNVLSAIKAAMWPDGVKPPDWPQIPMDIYRSNAEIVQDIEQFDSPIDVNAAVDLTIVKQ